MGVRSRRRPSGRILLMGLFFLTPSLGCAAPDDAPASPSTGCLSDDACQDDNPCTRHICRVDGTCEAIGQGGVPCSDGDACTQGDLCDAQGACIGGPSLLSAEGPCEICSCDAELGLQCEPLPLGSLCNDGDCCTLVDTCQPCDRSTDPTCDAHGQSCGGSAKDCTDDNVCTIEACACIDDDPTCQYQSVADGGACDYDGSDCTVGDFCQAGQCMLSEPLALSDGNPCTVDSCLKGQILHDKLLEGQCDDGDECTSDDHCQLGVCVGGPQVQCVKPPCGSSASCVSGAGCVVQWLPIGAACSDNNACSLGDYCDGTHHCTSMAFQNCEDGDPCTQDACLPAEGCVSTFDELTCPVGPCSQSTDCDDDNGCTEDTCDGDTGLCVHVSVASSTCMLLENGNNLISFSSLPEDADLTDVLGPAEPYVVHIFSEAQFAWRLSSGEWRGNLKTLDRRRGYWIYMNLPPDLSPMGLPLAGLATDPDVTYQLHEGVNLVSFAGPPNSPTDSAIGQANEGFFTSVVGQGLALFPNNGSWIGSLTTLEPNKGYELLVTAPIDSFQYQCDGCDGVDPYLHGCTHPAATNQVLQAELDDGSCVFDLPEGWATPAWSTKKDQAFVIFRDLQLGGLLLEENDAVAAFIGGECRGVGFPLGNETTVPMLGGAEGETVTFQIFDQSAGTLHDLGLSSPVDWSLNAVLLAGCMDPTQPNYDPFAMVEPNPVLCD